MLMLLKINQYNKNRSIYKDDLIVEESPFTFPVKEKKGHYQIQSAPWVYIDNLPRYVISLLHSLKM